MNRCVLGIAVMVTLSMFVGVNASYAEETGRYQLFQGEYQFVNLKGEEFWSKALFKVDTVTGKVWIGNQLQWVDDNGKAKQKRTWRPFEEEIDISGQGRRSQSPTSTKN